MRFPGTSRTTSTQRGHLPPAGPKHGDVAVRDKPPADLVLLELGASGGFDENGLGEPAVWTTGGSYWMPYTGRDHGERRRIGLTRSADGVHWQREPSFTPIAGTDLWNREVVCDPSLEPMPAGSLRVWFGGRDRPEPDHGLNGQIGVGVLK